LAFSFFVAFRRDPAAATNPDGTIEVFARTALNLDLWQFVLQNPSDPDSWSIPTECACLAPPAPCWNTQPVFPTSDVTLNRAADGRLELYYRGFDGFLYVVRQVDPGSAKKYHPPTSVGVIVE
jgi:hypothetical protein